MDVHASRYLRVLLLIAAIALCAQALELVFKATGGFLSIYKKSGASIVIVYLVAIIAVGAFMKVASPVGWAQYARLYYSAGRTAARGFALFFCVASLAVLLLYLVLAQAGQLQWSLGDRLTPLYAVTLFLDVLIGCVLATAEEILFRGFLVSYLRWNASRVVTGSAVLVSSLLFACAHDIRDPLAWFTPERFPLFVGLTLLGILLATTYMATASLSCSIGLHAGLLAVGEILPRGGLVSIDFAPWWLGGDHDIRMAPITWTVFIGLTVAVVLARRGLSRHLAVERPFVGIPLQTTPGRGEPSVQTADAE